MTDLKIPVGVSDFEEIRRNGYYYIDKTGLINELLKTSATKVTLITRPRRFGKTLGMSMLAHFFDISKDSSALFEGLEIAQNRELCEKWMNRWPTLFVTFKDVGGLTFSGAYGLLKGVLADLCKNYVYLTKSEAVDEDDKKVFFSLKAEDADSAQVSRCLNVLLRMMNAYYGRPAILILDEYDVPVARASSNGYYEEMLELMKTMMSTALKDNPSLCFAVVTGCLRITKESIFTGTNNFVTDTISDNRYNEYFGFTEKEVRKLLEEADCSRQLKKIQKWYDGYHFGDMDIYCPWDVLNYVQKLMTEGKEEPENYWEHTSDNAVILSFLERTDFSVAEKFEILLRGNYIKERIEENLTYHFLTATEENLWSLLYATGYLTRVRIQEMESGDTLEDGQAALKIPNEEVMDIFRKKVVEWFRGKAAKSDRAVLFQAVWGGNEEKLTEILSDLLFDTISYHDYAESFYHAFLTGLFSCAGYAVESNFENGLGRSDIVIKDRNKRRAVVIEAKIADSEEQLETECQEALEQIEDKQYAKKVERSGFRTVLRYGIAFYQKSCLVKKALIF